MKNSFFFLLISLLFLNCEKDRERNPYLPEARFNTKINLNLPMYDNLKQPLSPVYLDNVGLRGVIVINVGGTIFARERACPNHPLSDCSTMQTKDNRIFECPCDEVTYDIATGAPIKGNSNYSMLDYRVSTNGNILTIYN
ncbi:MAG: hypothetical protein Q3983_08560 [Capnocytophaga sp.]|nr:hypothetical protein [Capnocytophaga sp.]